MADEVQSNIRIDIDTTNALASIKNLQRQISAFQAQMSKGSAEQAYQARQQQQNLLNNINATNAFTAQIKKIRTTSESFTNALEKNKLSIGEYFRYAGASSKSFGRLFKTEFDTINKVARERVKDLQTQYIKLGRDASGAMQAIAVRPLVLDMENLATKQAIVAQRQQLLNQLLKQGSTNLLNFGKNTQWAGRQLMVGFTIPLGMMGSAAGKAFMQLEEQAIRFKRVYGDSMTASSETDNMIEQVKTLAGEFTKYGIAVEKTVALAADAAAMGKTGADLLAQVSEATRLSALGGVEQQQALETTISVANAFGVAAEDLAGKIDFLNAVENQTVTSIQDLTIAIPKAGPVIQQMGGNVEDLAFLLTAMKEGGINASEGANALKSGLASMINPTGKAAEMLQGFGINLKAIVEANQGDVKSTVITFAQALDKLDPLNRARAIEQLFGKFQFSRISTLFQNVVSEGTQASRVLDLAAMTAEDLAALSAKELNRISESPMYKFKKAIEDIKVSLAPLGEVFLNIATPIIEFGNKILTAFNNLDEKTKTFIAGLVTVVGGIGPVLLMTFGLLANGLANIIKGFTFVKNVFNKTSTASTDLGSQIGYMTTEQIQAASVAASLDQVHSKLTQTFSSEAGAIDKLTSAYGRAIAAQSRMPMGASIVSAAPKKFAIGGFVPGSGNGDTIPAMLTPGEFVVNKAAAQKAMPFLEALNSGKIQGFEDGGKAGRRSLSYAKYDALFPGFSDIFRSTSQSSGLDNVLGKLVKIANTLTEIAGDTPGASSVTGVNAAHGNARRILSVEDARALGEAMYAAGESGRTARKLKNAQQYGTEDISAFSNLVFPMPRAANLGEISGEDLSKWVSNDPSRFTSMIAQNQNIDPDDPGLIDFANRVASTMASAGAKAITEGNFEQIIAEAIDQQTEGAAKEALIKARDTYSTFNVTDDPSKRAKREPAAKNFGMLASGKLSTDTESSSYLRVRQAMARSGQWKDFSKDANDFVKNVVSKMVQGIKDSTRQASPSKEAYEAGENIGKGAIQGIEDSGKKARKVGRAIASQGAPGQSQIGFIASQQPTSSQTQKNEAKNRRAQRPGDLESRQLQMANSTKDLSQSTQNASKEMRGFGNLVRNSSYAISSLSGVAMLFGGEVSDLVSKIFMASSAFSALATVSEILKGTQLGLAATQRASAAMDSIPAAGPISGFKKIFAGIKAFFSTPIVKLGMTIGQLTSIIGLATLAIGGLFALINFNNKIQEEARLKIEGLGDAATLTKDKLNALGSFFNKQPVVNAVGLVGQTSSPVSGEQQQKIKTLREDEGFKAAFEKDIAILSKATKDQAIKTFESLSLTLFSQGYVKEEVQAVIDAIKAEAKRADVKFEVNSFDINTAEGKAAFAQSANELVNDFAKAYKTGFKKTLVPVISGNMLLGYKDVIEQTDEYEAELSTASTNIANRLIALQTLFQQGKISAKQYSEQWKVLTDALKNSAGSVELTQAVFDNFRTQLKEQNPEFEKLISGVTGTGNQILVMQALMSGAIPTVEALTTALADLRTIQAFESGDSGIGISEYLGAKERIKAVSDTIAKATAAQEKANKAAKEYVAPGSTGGTTKESPVAGLLKDLQNIAKVTVNAAGGIAEIMRLFGSSKASLTAFSGLESKISKISSNEEFINYLTNADAATQKLFFTIKRGGVVLTSYGKALERAYNAKSIGAFIVAQQKEIRMTNAGASAKKILIKAGIDQAKATELAANADIRAAYAAATATKGARARAAAINAVTNAIKQNIAATEESKTADEKFNDLYSKVMEKFAADESRINIQFDMATAIDNEIIAKAQDEIAKLRYSVDGWQQQLEEVQGKEDLVNKAYDDRVEALDKIEEANSRIAESQKQQMDFAQALSSGDIAAAARAARELRAKQAADALARQREALDAARANDLASIRSSAGNTRLQIETKIKDLEQEIADIENSRIKPAEERIRLATVERDLKLTALTNEKLKWEDLKTQIDVAKLAVIDYIAALKEANALMLEFMGNKDKKDSVSEDKDKAKEETKDKVTSTIPSSTPTSNALKTTVSKLVADTKSTKTAVAASTSLAKLAGVTIAKTTADAADKKISSLIKSTGASTAKSAATVAPQIRKSLLRSSGGIVPKYFADGGLARGTDTVPAMLTPGEFIISRGAAASIGLETLNNINSGKGLGLDSLGIDANMYNITDNSGTYNQTRITENRSSNYSSVYNSYSVNVNVKSDANPNEIARTVVAQINRVNDQRLRGNRY